MFTHEQGTLARNRCTGSHIPTPIYLPPTTATTTTTPTYIVCLPELWSIHPREIEWIEGGLERAAEVDEAATR